MEHVGGIRYRLSESLCWSIGSKDGPVYDVPRGFEFDVSIPRALWWAFSPHDRRYLKAAALHDHMLLSGWSKATAAATFYEALKADKVPRLRRYLMFAGVLVWTLR